MMNHKLDTDTQVFFYEIRLAPSAHEAFKIAEQYKEHRRSDWDIIKVPTIWQASSVPRPNSMSTSVVSCWRPATVS